MTTNRRSSPAAVLIATAVLLLPVTYVLSVGPAIWLTSHGYLSDDVGLIYAPLEFLYEHSKPIHDSFDWYIGLWIDK